MDDNRLFIVNDINKKKICISICIEGKWLAIKDLEKTYEEFFKVQKHVTPEITLKNYKMEYEKPFVKTPLSYKRRYLIRKNCLYRVDSSVKDLSNFKYEEFYMNFQQAIQATKEGARVARENWETNMYMWWGGSYCLHTHPYFDFQVKSPSLSGYFYVCEKDDATTEDWKLVDA